MFEKSLESSAFSSPGKIRPYIPEGKTTIVEAKQREGKTLLLVIMALEAWQTGRNVFSNIQLGFPHEPLNFNQIKLQDGVSPFWNGHVLIDELNFYFDGRRSFKAESIEFSAWLLQQKKQGCNLTGSTHDLMSLDIRMRENFDRIAYPKVWPPYPQVPQVIKIVFENGPTTRFFRKTVIIPAAPFLNLYDTFAVYDPFKKAESDEDEPPSRRRVNL